MISRTVRGTALAAVVFSSLVPAGRAGLAGTAEPATRTVFLTAMEASPGFVAVQQGDRVTLRVFVVNGDEHEVRLSAPDGQFLVPREIWRRGREYSLTFLADQAGPYELICSNHGPTMTATVLALPR